MRAIDQLAGARALYEARDRDKSALVYARYARHRFVLSTSTLSNSRQTSILLKILGGAEYNHIGSDAFGPLKADHSAYCPGDLMHAEREEKCVSVQEHTWGTDGLAKLEAIKAKVDPQGLFQCQKCVGFKGPVRDQ